MLQERQIVNDLGNQIDIEYTLYMKYPITYFHSITWMLISVNVTIHRTQPLLRYQNSHCIILRTTLLWSIYKLWALSRVLDQVQLLLSGHSTILRISSSVGARSSAHFLHFGRPCVIFFQEIRMSFISMKSFMALT